MQTGLRTDRRSEGAANGSRELVQHTLAGIKVKRVPVGPLAVHFCARAAGVSLQEYSTNATTLAESVIRYYETFRPDAVWVSADTWVSAEAMGAKVISPDPNQPLCGNGEPCVRTAADIDRIPPPDPGSQGRYPILLEALERVRKAIGSEVFVVACFDQYPFSLAAALLGVDQIMLKLHDDRSMVRDLMERCLEYGRVYATALGAAGADMLSGGDSPAGLIGPRAYKEMAWPFEKRLITDVKSATDKPVSLHICGNATRILGQMAVAGADVLEIDHQVDLVEACRLAGPDVVLWGNLDPVGVLSQGNPEDIRKAAHEAVDAVRTSGHSRFVLSSGCTLAVDTPFANLEALLKTQ